jgi:ribonuclease HII
MLNLETESKYFGRGYQLVGGVDEAGRGPLAGPVVAACVVIGPDFKIDNDDLALINDSKKLTAKKREHLFGVIKAKAWAVAIGVADNRTIDKINILQASFLAMRRAIKALPVDPDYILLDGRFKIPKLDKPQTAIIQGDAKIWTIAAASIIAKVSRDWLITELDRQYPVYEFRRHKGYGTKLHLAKLHEYGPCPIHRFSFAPVREAAKKINR